MNSLVNFSFENSSIRTITDDKKEVWFVAKDVAEALGYANGQQAVRAHCKRMVDTATLGVLSSSTLQPHTQLIPESDLYRLIMRSTLDSAEAFADWVVEEVLPQIRRTGKYAPTPKQLYLEKLDETTSKINELAAIDSKTLLKAARTAKQAGVSVEFLAAEIKDKIEPVSTWALSKLYGVTETRMNQLLSFAGLQNNIFELTDKGREFGRVLFDGNTAAITLWLPETIDYVRSQA